MYESVPFAGEVFVNHAQMVPVVRSGSETFTAILAQKLLLLNKTKPWFKPARQLFFIKKSFLKTVKFSKIKVKKGF